MCWNVEVSFFTFVLGTAVNAAFTSITPEKPVVAMSAIYQYVLSMQVVEGLMWLYPANMAISNATFALNFSQPLIFGLILLTISDNCTYNYIAAALLIIFSVVSLFLYRQYASNKTAVYVNHDHLQCPWWDDLLHMRYPFLIAMVSMVALLLRPWKFALYNCLFIVGSNVLATLLFFRSVPTMWCWFAASAPAFNVLFWHLAKDKTNEDTLKVTTDLKVE